MISSAGAELNCIMIYSLTCNGPGKGRLFFLTNKGRLSKEAFTIVTALLMGML